jgi:mRNA-degrading endonuclease RelE of RelBE toxin-antitoxin system
MAEIHLKQMPGFKKKYKKLTPKVKEIVDEAIRTIIKNPNAGEEKKGDLRGVFVYKFKVSLQQYLLAYEWNIKTRLLLGLGLHENFYRDLKRHR